METLDHTPPKTGPAVSGTPLGSPSRRDSLLVLLVVAAQLLVIWAFPSVPTQDGPVHVASAIAFRDMNEPGTSYAELFERRLEPFPNWTSHVLLAGLTGLVKPWVAEKGLLSLWLVLWPLGAWRLAGVLGADRGTAAGVAALLAFSRVFWLGFYNFLLGSALALLVLAWCLARRGRASTRATVVLAALLLVLFFTHLGAWALAATVLVVLELLSRRAPFRLLAALMPSLLLVAFFVYGTATAPSDGARRALRADSEIDVGLLGALRLEWFEAHGGLGATALTLATLALLGALVAGGGVGPRLTPGGAERRVMLALAGLGAVAFVFGPDDIGPDAGFFKARLALVAPLLLVLGLPRARAALGRWLLISVLGASLWSTGAAALFLSGVQSEIREFVAARDEVGRNKTLVLIRGDTPEGPFDVVNPNLYCLGTGNASATNYQAGTRHFPLKYRPGIRRAAREMARQTRPVWTDVALLWDVDEPHPRGLTRDYAETYRRGRLRVFARRPDTPGRP